MNATTVAIKHPNTCMHIWVKERCISEVPWLLWHAIISRQQCASWHVSNTCSKWTLQLSQSTIPHESTCKHLWVKECCQTLVCMSEWKNAASLKYVDCSDMRLSPDKNAQVDMYQIDVKNERCNCHNQLSGMKCSQGRMNARCIWQLSRYADVRVLNDHSSTGWNTQLTDKFVCSRESTEWLSDWNNVAKHLYAYLGERTLHLWSTLTALTCNYLQTKMRKLSCIKYM